MIKELVDKLGVIAIIVNSESDIDHITNKLLKENFEVNYRVASDMRIAFYNFNKLLIIVHKDKDGTKPKYCFNWDSYEFIRKFKPDTFKCPQFTCNYLIEIKKERTSVKTKPVEITLDEARKWYDSNDPVLQMLATQAWGDECKTITYDEIDSKVRTAPAIIETCDTLTTHVINKLQNIAKFYNKDWTPANEGTKYFISFNHKRGEWAVIKHESVKYLGLVYFKNGRDAERAIEILRDDLKLLEN